MEDKRIAWAITGAGHVLVECIDTLLRYERVDLFISRAAEEVLRMYDLQARIHASSLKVYREDAASAPMAARFFSGIYKVFVVAPATSNSVAKFVYGISDTLVTNLFAQAGKSRVPIVVYPTDLEPDMQSTGPHGEPLRVYPRPIDLKNTEALRRLAGTTVVGTGGELTKCLATYL